MPCLVHLPFERVPLIALYTPDRSVAVSLNVLYRLSHLEALSVEFIFNSVQQTPAYIRPGNIQKNARNIRFYFFTFTFPKN